MHWLTHPSAAVRAMLACVGVTAASAMAAESPGEAQVPAPQIEVEQRVAYRFSESGIAFEARLDYTIADADVAELHFELGEGVVLDGAVGEEGMPLEFSCDADALTAAVRLPEPHRGQLHVVLNGRQIIDPELKLETLFLPVPTPLGVARESGRIEFFAAPTLELRVLEADVLGATRAPSEGATAPDGYRHVSSWRYEGRPLEMLVETQPREPDAAPATPVADAPGSLDVDAPLAADIEAAQSATPRSIALPNAHVAHAAIEVVLPREAFAPTAWYRCRFVVQSAECTQLPILLPAGAGDDGLAIDTITIDGQATAIVEDPTHAVAGWRRIAVAPRDGDFPANGCEIALQFRLRLHEPPFEGFGSPLRLLLPRVAPDAAVTAATRVVVRIPEEYSLIGTPTGWVRETSVRPAWYAIGPRRSETTTAPVNASAGDPLPLPAAAAGDAWQFSRLGGEDEIRLVWWDMAFATRVLSLAALVIVLVLRATSWRNRLTLAAAAVFAAYLVSLEDSSLVVHVWVAAQPGVVAAIVFSLVRGTRVRSAAERKTAAENRAEGKPGESARIVSAKKPAAAGEPVRSAA
ncbi:MAG: hypothetical protein KY476_09960 [Planctomycetes bacterium]|nr:hypothetical protein [Planctomycetota bacterium]